MRLGVTGRVTDGPGGLDAASATVTTAGGHGSSATSSLQCGVMRIIVTSDSTRESVATGSASTEAAEAVFRHQCRECLDIALSRKVVDRVGGPAAFLDSVELECLAANARDVTLLNLDLERMQVGRGACPPLPRGTADPVEQHFWSRVRGWAMSGTLHTVFSLTRDPRRSPLSLALSPSPKGQGASGGKQRRFGLEPETERAKGVYGGTHSHKIDNALLHVFARAVAPHGDRRMHRTSSNPMLRDAGIESAHCMKFGRLGRSSEHTLRGCW